MRDAPYQVMPAPSAEDYAALEASILDQGVLEPILFDEAGNILDGHTRMAICKSLGLLDIPRTVMPGLSEQQKLVIAYDKNLARRQLTTQQKTDLIVKRLLVEASISDRALAGMLSVSHSTVGKKRKELIATGQIDQLEKRKGADGKERRLPKPKTMLMLVPETRENKKLLHENSKRIRNQDMAHSRNVKLDLLGEISKRQPDAVAGALPRGKYPIVYCDVPWTNEVYGHETGNDKSYPYPTMDLDEIKALCAGADSPALKDAGLFFWTTANRIEMAIDVIRSWGFDYKSQMVWDKVNQGTGRWVFDCHEILMIATRGNFPAPIAGTQERSIYTEKKQEHSRKPAHFAEMIQRYYPNVPKLEMFQRKQSLAADDVRLNGEWSFWGNEAGTNDDVEAA